MADYFGLVDGSGNCTGDSDETFWTEFLVTGTFTYLSSGVYTCPGEGARTVEALQAYLKLDSGAVNVRLAIFDASLALVCQGTAEVAVSGASYSWIGHAAAGLTWYNSYTALTGGSTYHIGVGFDGSSGNVVGLRTLGAQTSEAGWYAETDRTGGWPDPLSGYSNVTSVPGVRVALASGGGNKSLSVDAGSYSQIGTAANLFKSYSAWLRHRRV